MKWFLLSTALALPLIAQGIQPAQPQGQPQGQAQGQQPQGQANQNQQAQNLNGEWTVEYAEMDGKKIEKSGFTQVTINNNVITCRHDGKVKSWKLEFGPHHMVRCLEQVDGKATGEVQGQPRETSGQAHHSHHGVYIASPEYFCVSLDKGWDNRQFGFEKRDGEKGGQPAGMFRFGEHGPQMSGFVLILHRNETGKTPKTP